MGQLRKMSTKGSAGNSIDAKREEFRKYLDKEGVLEYLTKQLVRLYEEADKPSNALDYLKNNFSGKDTEVAQLKAENLEKENVQLKEKIKVLESEKALGVQNQTIERSFGCKRKQFSIGNTTTRYTKRQCRKDRRR